MRFYAVLFLCSLFLFYFPAFSQQYKAIHYSMESGLPTDNLYAVAQDQQGFIWLASSQGLLKYNGLEFTPILLGGKTRPVYDLSINSHDQLTVLSMDGVWKMDLSENGVSNSRLISILWNPSPGDKLFEDKNGYTWVSSLGKMLRLDRSRPSSYAVERGEQIHLLEDQQNRLWGIGSRGNMYVYDEQQDKFIDQRLPNKLGRIRHVVKTSAHSFLIGGEYLHEVFIDETAKIEKLDRLPIQSDSISCLLSGPKGERLIATYDKGIIHAYTSNSTELLTFKHIRDILMDTQQNIWIASAEGLGLLKSQSFTKVDGLPNEGMLAMSIAPDSSIFCSTGNLFTLTRTANVFKSKKNTYSGWGKITGLAAVESGLWIGNADGRIFHRKQGGRYRSFNLFARGVISHLYADKNQSLWISQTSLEKPTIGIAKMNLDMEIQYYGEKEGFSNQILVTKEGRNGKLYCAGLGTTSYLYQLDEARDTFINLSQKIPFNIHSDFAVYDIEVDGGGTIWMGTTHGLLKLEEGKLERIGWELGLEEMEIRALLLGKSGGIWLATKKQGLLWYGNEQTVFFSEKNGLLAGTPIYQSLQQDPEGHIWLATTEGLFVSRVANPAPSQTQTPIFTSIQANEASLLPHTKNAVVLPYQSRLKASFVALSYPANTLEYQRRIVGKELNWSAPFRLHQLSLFKLPTGNYSMEIRARQEEGFTWSKPLRYTFSVRQAWYLQPIAIALYIFLFVCIIVVVVHIVSRHLRKRIHKLKSLISARTAELEKVRQEVLEARLAKTDR